MLVEERKAHLLRILTQTGRVIAADASQSMGVSEDTIRRDLRELAKEGRLKRVHGGAVPVSPATVPFSGRLAIADEEKAEIGKHAAQMVEESQLVFLDGGTTAVHLARNLPRDLRATVVTHSPNVALDLMNHEHVHIEIVGGRLFRHSIVTVGAATLVWLGRYRPDICFIGATGLHPEHGITTGDGEEAEIKRSIISMSGASYILASSEKIGAVSSFVIADFKQVDGVITTSKADRSLRNRLVSRGCRIILAGRR
jgi:DeoR/GlpR family transcriptional regulator of sugar metabolism